jgi:hypothetical protein
MAVFMMRYIGSVGMVDPVGMFGGWWLVMSDGCCGMNENEMIDGGLY